MKIEFYVYEILQIYLDAVLGPIYNNTICMDSRYQISRHYNIHGLYSHFIVEATAK